MALIKRISLDVVLTPAQVVSLRNVVEPLWGTQLQRIESINITKIWDKGSSTWKWCLSVAGTKVVTEAELMVGETIEKE